MSNRDGGGVGGEGAARRGTCHRGGGAKSAVSRASCPRSFCPTIHLHRSRLRCVELAPCSALATWSEMSYVVPSRLYGPSVKPRTQQSRRPERGRSGGGLDTQPHCSWNSGGEREIARRRETEKETRTHTHRPWCVDILFYKSLLGCTNGGCLLGRAALAIWWRPAQAVATGVVAVSGTVDPQS